MIPSKGEALITVYMLSRCAQGFKYSEMIFLVLVFWRENQLSRGFPQTAVTAL